MAEQNTKENLLPAVADGAEGAVDACIDRYGGLVWSLARRICPNTAEAEDAVQDVFVSLWRSAHRFNPELGSEPTFVAMIARRRLIDRVRRITRGPDMVPIDEKFTRAAPGTAQGDADGVSAPGENFSLTEESGIAQAAIRELSEDQQKVLRLSVVRGLSHEKIATALDMPLGTVKTHIRRGLIKVRKILAERKAEQNIEASGSGRTAMTTGGSSGVTP